MDGADLGGRTAVVTGATSGLGFEVAVGLASRGMRVLLGCRDRGRGERAIEQLAARVPAADVELLTVDLADLASVREAAAGVDGPLDLLVNNAGVMAVPRSTTRDGFETHLGVNHLGHFALTGLLLPQLLARPAARVVAVSSNMAVLGKIRLDDLGSERRYGRLRAYEQSKLANLLFALELDRRARGALCSVAAHPGYAATNLQVSGSRASGRSLEERMYRAGNRLYAQSASDGARPILHAALAPEVRGGDYFGPRGPLQMRGPVAPIKPPRAARDQDTARRLWEASERMTGVGYDALAAAAAT